jgi:hypothetical protein
MAQDPEQNAAAGEVDPSHELDMVTLFSSSAIDAEMESNTIRSLLESNGIPAVVVGPATIPSLEFQVQAPRAAADEARRLIEEAQAGGPEAAAEAEAASEPSE